MWPAAVILQVSSMALICSFIAQVYFLQALEAQGTSLPEGSSYMCKHACVYVG